MTRSLCAVLESRCAWCEMLTLSAEAREELNFWSSSLEEYNSQPIWHTPSAVRVVYTDASDTGYEGYVELAVVWLVLQAVAEKLLNYRVRWFTDNQNVVHILQVERFLSCMLFP